MCNSEFSESLSNALFSQLKDVFTLYFFDFLFNIKPSTLVLADKTRRLFEVLSLFLLLSLLFCLLGQRHNKLLDRHLIPACGRSEAGMFPRLRGLPCRHSSCYDVAKLMSTCWAGFPETARHHKVAPFEFGYHSFWQNDRASAFVSFWAAWTWLPSSFLLGPHC